METKTDSELISQLVSRLREAEIRCAALESLLTIRSNDGVAAPTERPNGTPIALSVAIEQRRREYPETSPLARARFDHFARRLMATMEARTSEHTDDARADDDRGRKPTLQDITCSHVKALLATIENPCTSNGFLASAKAFFRWCVKRRLLSTSPAEGIDPRPEPRREPHFFTAAQVRNIFLMAAKPKTDPSIGVFLTLGFLCGMRTSEILRARARDIDIKDGTVRVPVPKGYWRGTPPRLIQAPENAVTWLRWFLPRNPLPPDAPVAASLDAVRKWKKQCLAPLGLGWGRDEFRNVMRHTACTMHVAAFRNLAETQLFLGHTQGSSITARHYLGLATRAEGAEYWSILPPAGRRHHPSSQTSWKTTRTRATAHDSRFVIVPLDLLQCSERIVNSEKVAGIASVGEKLSSQLPIIGSDGTVDFGDIVAPWDPTEERRG